MKKLNLPEIPKKWRRLFFAPMRIYLLWGIDVRRNEVIDLAQQGIDLCNQKEQFMKSSSISLKEMDEVLERLKDTGERMGRAVEQATQLENRLRVLT